MENHLRRQYRRYEIAWYDLHYTDNLADNILEHKLYDDAKIKRSTERLAFHTALVVTYARPFTEAEGFVSLPSGILKILEPNQRELHEAIIDLRNEVYAHTDSDHFSVDMENIGEGKRATTSSPRLFTFGMPIEVTEEIKIMAINLQEEIRRRQGEIEIKLQETGSA